MFGGLIGIVRDYAATTHQDTDAATKDLAAIFADPAKGIDTLIQKVGGIDDKTKQYVRRSFTSHDRSGVEHRLRERPGTFISKRRSRWTNEYLGPIRCRGPAGPAGQTAL